MNITAHYPNQASRFAKSALGGLALRTLRVWVMVCYVLRPGSDNSYFGSRCSSCLFGRYAQGGVDPPPPSRSAPAGLPKSKAITISPASTFMVSSRAAYRFDHRIGRHRRAIHGPLRRQCGTLGELRTALISTLDRIRQLVRQCVSATSRG